MNEQQLISKAMAVLGSRKSPAKAEAARKNGALHGGRPRKYPKCKAVRHRFWKGKCTKCGISQNGGSK